MKTANFIKKTLRIFKIGIILYIFLCSLFYIPLTCAQPVLLYHFNQQTPPFNNSGSCACPMPGGINNINWLSSSTAAPDQGIIQTPAADGYLKFTSNGSSSLNNEVQVTLPSPGGTGLYAITVEMLFKFGSVFDVHYRPYFFRITEGAGGGSPLKVLATFEYPSINLVHRNGSATGSPSL